MANVSYGDEYWRKSAELPMVDRKDRREPWYGVQSYYWDPALQLYRDRVVAFLAESFDHAMQQAADDAEEYAEERGLDVLDLLTSHHAFEQIIENGMELFSVMRRSELGFEEFLGTFYDPP